MAARARVDLSAKVDRGCVAEDGYAMAALLVTLAVMGVMLTVLLPAWSTQAKREKEAELVFRGEQYARAIRLFGQRFPNVLPPNVDVLVRDKWLRKKYKDPMTGEDFVIVGPGAALPGSVGQPSGPRGGVPAAGSGAGAAPARGGAVIQPGGRGRGGPATVGPTAGVAGVASSSTDTSLRLYNGRSKYNEWIFMPVQGTTAAGRGGARGGNQPGLPGIGGPGNRGAGGPAPGAPGQQPPVGGRGRGRGGP